MRTPGDLLTLLETPRFPVLVLGIVLVLLLPSIFSGWQMDDHLQRLVMSGPSSTGFQPMDLFGTLSGEDRLMEEFRDKGVIPFWTSPDFRLAFLRPLTVFTVWVDYRLWPDLPVMMHLHSFAWFALLLFAASRLFRSIQGTVSVSGLAILLYAIDAAHAIPLSWIAARHILISASFGVLAVYEYHRWRTEHWKPGMILAPLFFALALLGGEMGLAALAYMAGHALFLEEGRFRSRFTPLLPSLAVLLGWVVVYRTFGFGASGSGTYIDPTSDVTGFMRSLLTGGPLLVAAQFFSLPVDLVNVLPSAAGPVLFVTSLLLIGAVIWLCTEVIRTNRAARFWAGGIVMSVVPIASTLPSGRLMSFVALGSAGLLSVVAGELLRVRSVRRKNEHRIQIRLLLFVLVLNLVLSPVLIPLTGYSLNAMDERIIAAIESVPDDEVIAGQDLIIVNPPDQLYYGAYILVVKTLESRPIPGRVSVLAAGPTSMKVTRLDSSAIRVEMEDGLLTGPFGRSFRSSESPLQPGEQMEAGALFAEVEAVNKEGDPIRMLYRFGVSLDDDRLRWIRWDEDRYVPFRVPEVGEAVDLPASRTPVDLM